MDSDKDTLISQQRERLFSSLSVPPIVKPCKIGEGILVVNPAECQRYREAFLSDKSSIVFFIPSSGTGSRMFDFLQQFLGSSGQEQAEEAKLFLSKLSSFAFYANISEEWRRNIELKDFDLLSFCDYLLGSKGLHFSALPKALFPFHRVDNRNYSPMERHLCQGRLFSGRIQSYHFTLQQEHFSLLQNFAMELNEDFPFEVDFSVQSSKSDSYVFDEFQRVLFHSSGEYLKRPSGHGALIENLNNLHSSLIFIKNIDNVQCPKQDNEVVACWELLAGVFLTVKQKIGEILQSKDIDALIALNERYQVLDDLQLGESWETLTQVLLRPLRVCGMVRNEGMSGGGPFWIRDEGILSKQIIEKSQIDPAQLSLLSESTHFNPVMIVASSFDAQDKPFNFDDFVREDMSMAVKKNHFGNSVYYLEKPGLWNGSMFHWNSVFIEIPSRLFSPVKNVMDLLNPCHHCL
ncbi:MAG: DUF4301 family protein [Bacteroidetes bacterium]|nr:DUF4301 family protein [Bacteroidota bacterium]MBM3424711.1 DUF4301 family protein [Bacteroidota bacterium]